MVGDPEARASEMKIHMLTAFGQKTRATVQRRRFVSNYSYTMRIESSASTLCLANAYRGIYGVCVGMTMQFDSNHSRRRRRCQLPVTEKPSDVFVDLVQWEKQKCPPARILFLSISKSVRACWTHMFDVPIMLNACKKKRRKKFLSNIAEATANLLMFFLFLSLCVANAKRMRFSRTRDNSQRRCRGKAWALKSMRNNFFRIFGARTLACVRVSISI